jgi:hypothetical protein
MVFFGVVFFGMVFFGMVCFDTVCFVLVCKLERSYEFAQGSVKKHQSKENVVWQRRRWSRIVRRIVRRRWR